VSDGTETGGTVVLRAARRHETGAAALRDRSGAPAARGDDGMGSVVVSAWGDFFFRERREVRCS
jgi:hypothetical protein